MSFQMTYNRPSKVDYLKGFEMAKMFEFEWYFGEGNDVIETEKAYGFQYYDTHCCYINERDKVFWLPKSQINIVPMTKDDYPEGMKHFFHEGTCLVQVPMWLARQHGYFKNVFN